MNKLTYMKDCSKAFIPNFSPLSDIYFKKDLNNWITSHYKELVSICKFIGGNKHEDLCQCCFEQLLKNKNFSQISEDTGRIYFFTRLVKNNFYSKTSPYYYQFEKNKFNEYIESNDDRTEELNIDKIEIDLDWVNEELDKLKKKDWYYARLFQIYIEEDCSITKLSKRTQIPINSASRDIRKVKQHLKQQKNYIL